MATSQIHGEKQIQASTITNDRIKSDEITNLKINAAAAIAFSKLAALSSAQILLGSGSNVATATTMTGDITINNTGVTNISSNVIMDADINSAAAIAFSKLATLSSANILVGSAGNVATSTAMTGDITISNAGVTNISSGVIMDADINAAAAIALSKLATAVIRADGVQAFTAAQSMGGFKLINLADGTAAQDAVTKSQLDAVSAGLDPKQSCRVATAVVLSGTMIADNGTPATGQRTYTTAAKTITWFATEGPTVIDGVTLTSGDRILVKNETSTSGPSAGEGRIYNGIYTRTSQDVWTRSTDMDGTPANEVSGGNYTFIEQGTANVNSGFVLQGNGILTLQTDNINWVQFTGTGSIVAGAGLSKTGNTLDVGDVNKGVQVNSDDLQLDASEGSHSTGGLEASANAWQFKIKLDGVTGGTVANSLNLSANGTGIKIDNSTITINGSNQLRIPAGVVDAGTLSTLSSTDFLRRTASSSLTSSNTLTISSGATLAIAAGAIWSIGGTTVTATATQLNALGTIVTRETPTGTVDGVNDTFTLAFAPTASSEEVYTNGLQQDSGAGNDYTITGAVITFLAGAIPQAGSKVRVSYRR